jgi:hypothetical protein
VPSREDAFVSHFRFLVDPLSLLAVEHQDKTGEFYMEKACSDAASLMPADPREDKLTRDCESATDHHTDEREDVGELAFAPVSGEERRDDGAPKLRPASM